jgi:hypothetical protein
MRPRAVLLSFALSATLVPAAAAWAADEPPALSPAQVALFESEHLRNIDAPTRLEYRFSHEPATPAERYVDRVLLDLRPRPDGAKDIWVDFLSAEHHVPYPPLAGFHGNPTLMYFLERDVNQMRSATGGAATYFRNRIRRALVDAAQLQPVEVSWQGKEEKAVEITLAPFRNDPHLASLPGMTEKRYRFVLCDTVPGTILEVGTEVPGETGQPPRMKETMTFDGQRPCTTDEGPCAPPGRP